MTSSPPADVPPAANGPRIAARLIARPVDQELKASFLDYAMSVIVARALPDVRDGLKPVHRRVLYAMSELGVRSDRPRRKSALIVGEVMGKYHPHGDLAIYDTLVRMAQAFSLRYPLVDGQGNFGCFTGDTKIKLLDGTEPTMEALAHRKEPFFVYSVDRNGRIAVGHGRDARITRRDAPLVEVVFDNGERVRCTPDHRFLLRDGAYKQAKDLTPDDSLFPGYFDLAPVKEELNDYLRVLQPTTGDHEFVHHLADAYNSAHGTAVATKGAFVRHHVNFNRFDNRPNNLVRMGFLEHLQTHAAHAKEVWKDGAFRRAQAEGVRRYWAENPEARERNRRRLVTQNRDPTFRALSAARRSPLLKARFADPALRRQISARARELWADPDYRAKMSRALRNVHRRPLAPQEQARVRQTISAKSRSMWADAAKRAAIADAIVAALASPEVRAKLSLGARDRWKRPAYRAKYRPDHFSRMARTLWARPATRAFHREKIQAQRSQPEFRLAQRTGVRASNLRRLAADPPMAHRLAAKAATSLHRKWQDDAYRARVVRSKVAGFVSDLLHRSEAATISPQDYERARRGANWVPRLDKALRYFGSFHAMIQAGKRYNHRIVEVRPLAETADVYDITVDEHHNFLLSAGAFVHNSVDGDNAAAMRYTEARLASIAEELLADLDKDTVDFAANYDATLVEPKVLPARFPNLLVNGSSGIAVGMATNVPPHNLGEIVDATVHLIDHPEAGLGDLLRFVQGPDFPTGGIVMGRAGLVEAYGSGRGKLAVRGRVHVETVAKDRPALIVSELPYQVNKADLLVSIAELAKEKRLEGIHDLRDESDREGMRVVIELKHDADPEVVLNQLYAHTTLQSTFGIQNLALVRGRPQTLGLKPLLESFVDHRVEVVTRRTRFELRKAEERAHILEGLLIALDHLDEAIQLIRTSRTVDDAQARLIGRFALTEPQAKAILDMRLAKLAALEVEQIREEHAGLLGKIAEYRRILADRREVLQIIKNELLDVRSKYPSPRRTQIVETEAEEIVHESLITEHEVVVTMTQAGYTKRIPLADYRTQGRGGKGVIGADTKAEDAVIDLFVASTHHYLMFFTTHGRCYWLKAYQVPEASRYARGSAIVNLLPGLEPAERVTAAIAVREFATDRFVFFATKKGVVKRTALSDFKNVRAAGIRAITLDPGDEVLGVALTSGAEDLVLARASGKAVRFHEAEVRPMGRTAAGVIGVALEEGDEVVGLAHVAGNEGDLLTIKANGRGKRTPVEDYPVKHRGTQGVITILTEETVDGQAVMSPVVGMVHVRPGDEAIVSTERAVVIRVPVDDVPQKGRAAQGNWIIRPEAGDRVVTIVRVAREVETAAAGTPQPAG